MIQEWLQEYKPATTQQAEQALREIMQEIALAGLERAGFFEKAAFYGGTALRIFHQLPRFSEDLDFSLLVKDDHFNLQPYLDEMVAQFASLGMEVSIVSKNKTAKSQIDSAFLKAGTTWKQLLLKSIVPQEKTGLRPDINIKVEIDTIPPGDFETEELLLLRPYSFYVKCFSLPDLFAGKMHALLFRKWKTRVKGRDWFDLEWYVRKGVPLHLDHLLRRAQDSGDWKEKKMTEKQLRDLVKQKIAEVSMEQVKTDAIKFIPDPSALNIWSPQYFTDLVSKMKISA